MKMAKGNRTSKNFRADGFEPVRNEAYHQAMVDIRRSSATSSHDTRPPRQRTRANAKRQAIRNGW
jgi:hypothetical protein